jgi:hypothetical protein
MDHHHQARLTVYRRIISSEHLCYQWSRAEPRGRIGVLSAHNLVKNLVQFATR